jgi:RNA polymerase sigma factor (sigma-70 family)
MTQPFDRAVAAHGATVLRVCRAVLGAGPDADDAWSETFLAALKAWPDLAEDTNLQAWLVRVAHRKAIDVTRVRKRHAVPTERLPDTMSTIGIPGSGDDDLWAAVAALPERQRLAVAYHYAGGLTHVQTAELIGGSADAVRRAAADGVRALRSRIGTYAADEATTQGGAR